MTQAERILQYMTDFGSITQREASDHLGVARLASRVNDLRKAGHPMISVREDGLNKFGEKCQWARYTLGGGA